ncbi:MAG: hydantoinase/oxoprolinase family protein [Minwuiales bacterium]|nr:hydantoinase/oxoprolinase family protein [Minwuiales bacterium]
MKLIGVDVGGTFTDVVFTDTEKNETVIHKVATTPDDPSQGVMTGILELCRRGGIDPAAIDHVYHGTTIATNAVLEYKGSKTGIVTTAGYRDIVHIGRHQRPQHYSIMQDIPWQARPLTRRRHRKVVEERLAPPKGEVLVPLNEEQVRVAARQLKEEGVEAIAVCFLFSYLDPKHEARAREIIAEEYPEAFVTTSASVSPQFREFERFTTAAMNAFIGPKVRTYVNQLSSALEEAGLKADLHIMRSNGGVATPAMISETPVLTLLSGPAAGVLGGAFAGQGLDRQGLITFDIGGTSADIGVVTDGRFSEATARDTWIAGYPVMVPMIDIHTIGAGGGSIAGTDAGGAFRVGPQSAGSVPGPAAYGRGGAEPTVTDANVVLGRLDKDNFLGGEMSLDDDASGRVIHDLAERLGLSDLEAAEGIITIVNSNMANAIRSRTVQKGIDPRGYSLVAFGGAGPLHGAEVAKMLSIPEVIVPPYPGITSAVGLLTTDLKYETIKTEFQVSTDIDFGRLNDDFAGMEASLREQFAADEVDLGGVSFARAADMRYVGQGYELRVDMPDGSIEPASLDDAFQRFHQQHTAEYGHHFADSPIEIVNIRLTGIGETPKIAPPAPKGGGSLEAARIKTSETVFRNGDELETVETAFYERDKLPIGERFDGPAIVLQTDSTTVVPPGCAAAADAHGNLIIEVGGD